MTKTLPGSFSIRWHKDLKNNLKNKFCRVEHTDTQKHRHTFSFIYIDKHKNFEEISNENDGYFM